MVTERDKKEHRFHTILIDVSQLCTAFSFKLLSFALTNVRQFKTRGSKMFLGFSHHFDGACLGSSRSNNIISFHYYQTIKWGYSMYEDKKLQCQQGKSLAS
jgi:hypothetical protein